MIRVTAKKEQLEKEIAKEGLKKIEGNLYMRLGSLYKCMYYMSSEQKEDELELVFCEVGKDEIPEGGVIR